jgi:electron transport complex protein RnfC
MNTIFKLTGGVNPPENKQQSIQRSIVSAAIPKHLVIPVGQHLGPPAKPIVQVGDHVLKGQCIATSDTFKGAPVHASSSGKVIAIEERPSNHASGLPGQCIVIECDGRDEWQYLPPMSDWQNADRDTLLQRIHDAGVIGMGGAGFPAASKLATHKPIHTLIMNGAECEPYITADQMLMTERADEIIASCELLMHLLGAEKTLFGIEDNKPEAIAAIKAAASKRVEVVVIPTIYPSGGSKQLIQILTGKEVPSGGHTSDIGLIMQNIATAVAAYRAIVFGEASITRITTLTGDAMGEPRNVEVLIGTPLSQLLEQGQWDPKRADRIIIGGPMMGYTITNTDLPVIKTTNCILVPTKQELPPPPPAQACIRCGLCAEACPASLLPQQMYWFSRGGELDKLKEHNIFDCIECGACSYSCPSNIPLVQYYRASKAEIKLAEEEALKADHARQRFEAREARLKRLEEEKAAQRAARAEAAKQRAAETAAAQQQAPDAADPVQAAIARAQAKRSGESSPTETVDLISKLEKRLTAAKVKLASAQTAGSDKVPLLQNAVDALDEQLREAKANPAPVVAEPVDPVQAAIERAKAKRAGTAPADTAVDEIAKLEKRLQTAIEKLEMARENAPDKLDAFQQGVDKLREKLATAKAKQEAGE